MYTLEKSNTATLDERYVVKLTPYTAPSKGTSSKKKKKKKNAQERNADTLFHEYSLYRNSMHGMLGRCVPDLPSSSSVPCYGECGGFRYLVMERMGRSLEDGEVLRGIVRNREFGKLCVCMVQHLEEMHEKCLLFVDVKPDNFMFAAGKGKVTSFKDVRMIDLGLVESYMDRSKSKHRDDVGGELVGTPAYASLNVHGGHTLSRRDDLEALGYVICKILRIVVSAKTSDALLPWEDASSDNVVERKKKVYRDDISSILYEPMVELDKQTMIKFFDICANFSYKEKPDYERLKKLLGKLVGSTGSNMSKSSKSSSIKAKRKAPRSPVKSPNSSVNSTKKLSCTPAIKQSSRKKLAKVDVISINDNSDNDSFMTAAEYEDQGDMQKENNMALNKVRITRSRNKQPAARLVVVEGPAKGEAIDIYQNTCDEVILGRDPSLQTKRKALSCWKLEQDETISRTHASIKVDVSKYDSSSISFTITDKESSNGTYVNDKLISRPRQIFSGKCFAGSRTYHYVFFVD